MLGTSGSYSTDQPISIIHAGQTVAVSLPFTIPAQPAPTKVSVIPTVGAWVADPHPNWAISGDNVQITQDSNSGDPGKYNLTSTLSNTYGRDLNQVDMRFACTDAAGNLVGGVVSAVGDPVTIVPASGPVGFSANMASTSTPTSCQVTGFPQLLDLSQLGYHALPQRQGG